MFVFQVSEWNFLLVFCLSMMRMTARLPRMPPTIQRTYTQRLRRSSGTVVQGSAIDWGVSLPTRKWGIAFSRFLLIPSQVGLYHTMQESEKRCNAHPEQPITVQQGAQLTNQGPGNPLLAGNVAMLKVAILITWIMQIVILPGQEFARIAGPWVQACDWSVPGNAGLWLAGSGLWGNWGEVWHLYCKNCALQVD